MQGPIERIILSGMHKKARAKNMDLNDQAQFEKFSTALDQVTKQVVMATTHIVENYTCNCGAKKVPGERIVHSTGPKQEESITTKPSVKPVVDTSETTGVTETTEVT